MITQLKQRLEPWLERVSRPRRFFYAGTWYEHGSRSLLVEQVVGRDHCLYVCLDLRHLPANKRSSALQYQIPSYSPWPDSKHQVAWHKGYAQLWVWSAETERGAGVVTHAEPVFWQPPATDGLYLYRCARGYDLQYWHERRLKGSQWYAGVPDRGQQHWFARSQGLPPTEVEPQSPALLPQPWASVRVNPFQGLAQRPNGVLRWAAYAFVLIASLQITALLQWQWQAGAYAKQHEELEQQLGEVLEYRARARDAVRQYQYLAPLLDTLDPLHVQQVVTERLASVAQFEVINWSRQHLQADITIETTADSTLTMVNALRGPGVTDVQAEPGPRPNQYRITLKLQPPLPWPEELPREG